MSKGSNGVLKPKRVLFMPRLGINLTSASKLADEEFEVHVEPGAMVLTKQKDLVRVVRKNGLYIMHAEEVAEGLAAEQAKQHENVSLQECIVHLLTSTLHG